MIDQSFVCSLLHSISIDKLMVVRDMLYHMSIGEIGDERGSICIRLRGVAPHQSERIIDQFEEWWKEWPLFSGRLSFPVPSPVDTCNPQEAFHSFPLWEGEYGENRKLLAKFLYDRLNLYIEFVHDLYTDKEYVQGIQGCHDELQRVFNLASDPLSADSIRNCGVCNIWSSAIPCHPSGSIGFKLLDLRQYLMNIWPKSTGVKGYPVPCVHDSGTDDPEKAWDKALLECKMWVGEYGALRLEMVRFMIGVTEAMLHTIKEISNV